MMKGGGGMTIYNVLLFYGIFLLFVAYVGTLASVNIVTIGGNPGQIPIPTSPLDLLGMFNFFVALLSTNSTIQIVTLIIVTPFIVLLLYGLMQLVRGTGGG